MFCPNCGKELDEDATNCKFCGKNLNEPEKGIDQEPTTLKNFILSAGRVLVDIDTAIGIGLAVLVMLIFWIGILGSFIPDENGYLESIRAVPVFMILSFLLPIVILIFVVLTKYITYLLIDIRDSLVEIKQQNKGE